MQYPTPQTVIDAWNSQMTTLASSSGSFAGTNKIDLSIITTQLIQNIGRFAEHNAGEFLHFWPIFEMLTQPHIVEPDFEESILIFGIHKDGVDDTEKFMLNAQFETARAAKFPREPWAPPADISAKYRKILGVQIYCGRKVGDKGWVIRDDTLIVVKLKDLTDAFENGLAKCDTHWKLQTGLNQICIRLREQLRNASKDIPVAYLEGISDHALQYELGNIPRGGAENGGIRP